MTQDPDLSRAPFATGLACRCPRCGKGKIFKGLLDLAPACAVCGFPLAEYDSGDGTAAFAILLIGFLVVGLALFVEVRFAPPLWVHAVLWLPVILGGSIGLLRPLKATLVAFQVRHKLRGE